MDSSQVFITDVSTEPGRFSLPVVEGRELNNTWPRGNLLLSPYNTCDRYTCYFIVINRLALTFDLHEGSLTFTNTL